MLRNLIQVMAALNGGAAVDTQWPSSIANERGARLLMDSVDSTFKMQSCSHGRA